MNLYFPSNFFSKVAANQLPGSLSGKVSFLPASIITAKVLEDDLSIGLIPTSDLIQHRELHVSSKFGLSFEGSLCNAYIYFKRDERKIDDFYLYGDLSSLEALMIKIMFKEFYNTDIELKLASSAKEAFENNSLIVGDLNFKDSSLLRGISFAEEIVELINLPFVNFVLASKDQELIEEFHTYLSEIDESVNIDLPLQNLSYNIDEDLKEYINSSVSSMVFKFNLQDIEGVNQLLRLPYYYGIINDIIEIKFV